MSDVLPLPAEAATNPTVEHIGIVGAWMVWPDNPEWRIKHTDTYEAMFVRDRLTKGDQLSQIGTIRAVDLALHATAPADLGRIGGPQIERGFGMGMVAYNVAMRAPRGEKAPVSTSLRELELALTGKQASTSSHVFKTWDGFKPVVAFWAAHIMLFDDVAQDMERFPCSPSDLPRFLARADAFRRLAEQTKIPNRAEPLLRPGTHVRLPDELLAKLPQGRLEIVPVRPQA